jgi:chromosome segregation ATPase
MLHVQLRHQRDSKDKEIEVFKVQNAGLTARVAELEDSQQRGASMVGPGFESRRERFEEALATVPPKLQSTVDDLRSIFADEQSQHERLAGTANELTKQRTEIAALKARIADMRRQHQTTVEERDQARTSLIRQVHALRKANEKRFARVRQIHIEEVQTLVDTYEARLSAG